MPRDKDIDRKKKRPPGFVWYKGPLDYPRSTRPGTPDDPNAIPDSGDPATRGLRRFAPPGVISMPTDIPKTPALPTTLPATGKPSAAPAQPQVKPVVVPESPIPAAPGQDFVDLMRPLLERGGIIQPRTQDAPGTVTISNQPPVGGFLGASIWPQGVAPAVQPGQAPQGQAVQPQAAPAPAAPALDVVTPRLAPTQRVQPLPEGALRDAQLTELSHLADRFDDPQHKTVDMLAGLYDQLIGAYGEGDFEKEAAIIGRFNPGSILPQLHYQRILMGPGTTSIEAAKALLNKPSDADVLAETEAAATAKLAKETAATEAKEKSAIEARRSKDATAIGANIKALEGDAALSLPAREASVKEEYDRWVGLYGKNHPLAPDEIKVIEERIEAGVANPYISPAKGRPPFGSTDETAHAKMVGGVIRGRKITTPAVLDAIGFVVTPATTTYKDGAVPAINLDEYRRLPGVEQNVDLAAFREILYKGGEYGEEGAKIKFGGLKAGLAKAIEKTKAFIRTRTTGNKKALLKRADEIGRQQFERQLLLPENIDLYRAWLKHDPEAKAEAEKRKVVAPDPAAPSREEINIVTSEADFDALPSGQNTLFIDPEGNTRRKP